MIGIYSQKYMQKFRLYGYRTAREFPRTVLTRSINERLKFYCQAEILEACPFSTGKANYHGFDQLLGKIC
jgi:hypothetical protein